MLNEKERKLRENEIRTYKRTRIQNKKEKNIRRKKEVIFI